MIDQNYMITAGVGGGVLGIADSGDNRVVLWHRGS
jgi:hypothetical protein